MNNTINGTMSRNLMQSSRQTGLLLLTLLLPIFNNALASEKHPLDNYFEKYAERYFGKTLDWRLFKAQGFVESRLNHKARSRRGARGVMQLMPATFREIQKKNSEFKQKKSTSPEVSIGAGICFDAYLFNRWDREVTPEKRIKLMLASYNGGYVRVLRAFNKAGQPENDWEAVARYLPRETRNYVDRVLRRYHAEKARKATPTTLPPRPLLAEND